MNTRLLQKYYHIKGTPTKEEQDSLSHEENYVSVELFYQKGIGYILEFWKEGRSNEGYSRVFDFAEGRSKDYVIIKCNRPGSKRAEEAIKLVNENLDKWLADFTKGYEIEQESVA